MSMLRGEDLQARAGRRRRRADGDPDRLAGPFAHVVVDEAQELTDAEWRMLLARCPSRSFTIVGRPRAGPARLRRVVAGAARAGRARAGSTESSLTINYRTPTEVMAEAEPVIRAASPTPTCRPRSAAAASPSATRAHADLDGLLADWLATHDEGIACVIGDPTFAATPRVRSLPPELAKGLEFDLVVLVEPGVVGRGRPVRRHDPGDPAAGGAVGQRSTGSRTPLIAWAICGLPLLMFVAITRGLRDVGVGVCRA